MRPHGATPQPRHPATPQVMSYTWGVSSPSHRADPTPNPIPGPKPKQVMSYNWGVFLTVVAGLSTGHALFMPTRAAAAADNPSLCH